MLHSFNASCAVFAEMGFVVLVVGNDLYNNMNKDELMFICGHEYGHYKNTHAALTLLKYFNKLSKGKFSANPYTRGTARSLKQELEADLYGAEYTSSDIAIKALKTLKNIIFKRYKYKDTEIDKRIEFIKYVKQHGTDISVDEYLTKNK